MYIGSVNFYKPAIDQTRNVGLIVKKRSLIGQVKKCFEEDIRNSRFKTYAHAKKIETVE